MLQTMRRSPPRGRRRATGFSVIEVLVAAAILLVIALSLIPLFSRSLLANKAGADATATSQFAISRVEALYQLDFNNAVLNPAVTDEYYSRRDEAWVDGTAPAGDPALWTRSTDVAQFNLSDLDDDGVFNDPLPMGTDPVFVHIKRIEITVDSARDQKNIFGGRSPLVVRTLKPF